ncbi:MAG: hypothetical protein Q9220_003493 [cf. Caloplaca sp. 1 TL-2023]
MNGSHNIPFTNAQISRKSTSTYQGPLGKATSIVTESPQNPQTSIDDQRRFLKESAFRLPFTGINVALSAARVAGQESPLSIRYSALHLLAWSLLIESHSGASQVVNPRKSSVASDSTTSSASSKRRIDVVNLISDDDDYDEDPITPKKVRHNVVRAESERLHQSRSPSITSSSSRIHISRPAQKFHAVEIPLKKPAAIVPRAPLAVAQRETFLRNLSELRGPRVTVVNEVDESSPSVNFTFVRLRCPVALRKGDFVDTYRGEIITVAEAEKRGVKRSPDEANYFMNFDKFCELEAIPKSEFLQQFPGKVAWHRQKVLDEDWEIYMKDGEEMWLNPEYIQYQYVCDGMKVGGPTRFMNHSCDPNCRLFTASYNHSDTNIYDLAFFTLEEIPAGTELTFDYKDEDDRSVITYEQAMKVKDVKGYMPQRCLCGTAECRQYFFN